MVQRADFMPETRVTLMRNPLRSTHLCLFVFLLVHWAEAQEPRDLKYEKSLSSIATLAPVSKRWALIVGVDQYEDKQITPLNAASNDATALADAFVRYAGFPKEQVIVLASNQSPERQPSRGNMLLRLANLSRLVPRSEER